MVSFSFKFLFSYRGKSCSNVLLHCSVKREFAPDLRVYMVWSCLGSEVLAWTVLRVHYCFKWRPLWGWLWVENGVFIGFESWLKPALGKSSLASFSAGIDFQSIMEFVRKPRKTSGPEMKRKVETWVFPHLQIQSTSDPKVLEKIRQKVPQSDTCVCCWLAAFPWGLRWMKYQQWSKDDFMETGG